MQLCALLISSCISVESLPVLCSYTSIWRLSQQCGLQISLIMAKFVQTLLLGWIVPVPRLFLSTTTNNPPPTHPLIILILYIYQIVIWSLFAPLAPQLVYWLSDSEHIHIYIYIYIWHLTARPNLFMKRGLLIANNVVDIEKCPKSIYDHFHFFSTDMTQRIRWWNLFLHSTPGNVCNTWLENGLSQNVMKTFPSHHLYDSIIVGDMEKWP